jgi:hypothetical protein
MNLVVRYVVNAHKRYEVRTQLYHAIVELLHGQKQAQRTMSRFPPIPNGKFEIIFSRRRQALVSWWLSWLAVRESSSAFFVALCECGSRATCRHFAMT